MSPCYLFIAHNLSPSLSTAHSLFFDSTCHVVFSAHNIRASDWHVCHARCGAGASEKVISVQCVEWVVSEKAKHSSCIFFFFALTRLWYFSRTTHGFCSGNEETKVLQRRGKKKRKRNILSSLWLCLCMCVYIRPISEAAVVLRC